MDRIAAYYSERNGGFWVAVRNEKVVGMFGLEPAATDGLPAQRCDEEQARRRPHRVDARGAAQRRIETGVEPAIDLGEVGVQALLGRRGAADVTNCR